MHRGNDLRTRSGPYGMDLDYDGDSLHPTQPSKRPRSPGMQDFTFNDREQEYRRTRTTALSSQQELVSRTPRYGSQRQQSQRYYEDADDTLFFNGHHTSSNGRGRIDQSMLASGPPPSRVIDELQKRISQLEQFKRHFDELQLVRFSEAEKALNEYKEAAERRMADADNLAQKLKEELEVKAKENQKLKTDLEEARAKLEEALGNADEKEQLNNEIASMRASVAQLEKERDEALAGQAEALATNRKLKSQLNASVDQATWRFIKELFEDLSGLVVTDVKKTSTGTTYNCVQTGKNGTIQFKLIQDEDPNVLLYQPMLDETRDVDLIRCLPKYLTHPIEFKRNKASLFHRKLLNALHAQSSSNNIDTSTS